MMDLGFSLENLKYGEIGKSQKRWILDFYRREQVAGTWSYLRRVIKKRNQKVMDLGFFSKRESCLFKRLWILDFSGRGSCLAEK